MKLHRDPDLTRKPAWHLVHRIREAWDRGEGLLGGPVEIDETCMGGKRCDMSRAQRKELVGITG